MYNSDEGDDLETLASMLASQWIVYVYFVIDIHFYFKQSIEVHLSCTWKEYCTLCHIREGRGKASASDFKSLTEEELIDIIEVVKIEDAPYTLS